MPELIPPTTALHAAWLEARDDWGPGTHEDGFGLRPSDEVGTPAGFAAFVTRLADRPGPATPGQPGTRCRWIVEDGRVLGAIALRYGREDPVRRLGHIGYGIRPSARRRGLATWALGRILDEARAVGLRRVLVVCEAGNTASARTIERNGGVLDAVTDPGRDALWRYWIEL